MLPEPPTPPSSKPPQLPASKTAPARAAGASGLRRRGSDQPSAAALPTSAAPPVLPAPPSLPAAAVPVARRAPRLPLPAVAALLAGSAAVIAAALAWVLLEVLGLSAGASAGLASAAALLAVAVPTLAVALRGMPRHGTAKSPEAAPVRDPDTGAVSRPLFMELAEREWSRSRRYGTGAGLLLVELDRGGRPGEPASGAGGDALLQALTRQTSPTLRGADFIARFAPTRLAVFLAQADPTGALDVAERIRERAEALGVPTLLTPGQPQPPMPLRGTVSVGVAQLRPAHLNLQALVHDAEDALAAARLAGGNCVRAAPVDTGASMLPGAWRDDGNSRRN